MTCSRPTTLQCYILKEFRHDARVPDSSMLPDTRSKQGKFVEFPAAPGALNPLT